MTISAGGRAGQYILFLSVALTINVVDDLVGFERALKRLLETA
jgi:hypothetical protein